MPYIGRSFAQTNCLGYNKLCAQTKIEIEPPFKGYSDFRLLSRNDFCSTWSANESGSSLKVLIKVANSDGPLDFNEVKRRLISSYKIQRSIRNRLILGPKTLETLGVEVGIVHDHMPQPFSAYSIRRRDLQSDAPEITS